MSTVIFRHELNHSYKDKSGQKFTVKETIIDGAKGLSFMFLNKQGEKFYRLVVKENEDAPDTFMVKEKEGEEEKPEKKMSMAELMKLIKGDEFKFIRDYIKNDRDDYRKALKGGKKASKSSKKSSSKKRSKKKMTGGKKSSKKKSSKKRSKKKMTGGKKSSKKKSSKKRSKKKMTGGKKSSKKKSSKKRSSKTRVIKGFSVSRA